MELEKNFSWKPKTKIPPQTAIQCTHSLKQISEPYILTKSEYIKTQTMFTEKIIISVCKICVFLEMVFCIKVAQPVKNITIKNLLLRMAEY